MPRFADMPTAMKRTGRGRPPERLDVGVELMAILRLGKQHARQESAKRGRQPHLFHQRRGGDDDEQRP